MSIFEQIKTAVDFPAVFERFCGAEVGSNGKAICPFHPESDPSFQVYPDGGKCYGCNWHGDAVQFVADLKGLRPYEAALEIAREFGIPVQGGGAGRSRQRSGTATAPVLTPSQAQARYRKLKQLAFLALVEFRDLAAGIFEQEGLDIEAELVDAVHLLPQVEYYLETLTIGPEDEKLQLLREGVLERWAKLWSFQLRIGTY